MNFHFQYGFVGRRVEDFAVVVLKWLTRHCLLYDDADLNRVVIGPLTEDSDWAIDYSSLDIHIDRPMDENDSLLDTGDVDDYNFVNRISLYPIKGDKAQINHQRYLFELHQLFFDVLYQHFP